MAMGRPSVFTPKDKKNRHQGILTEAGEKAFEKARTRLSKLSGIAAVSDADVMEYLARGEAVTRKILDSRT